VQTESTDIFHVHTAMQRSPDSRPLVCICRLEIIGNTRDWAVISFQQGARGQSSSIFHFNLCIWEFSHVPTVSSVMRFRTWSMVAWCNAKWVQQLPPRESGGTPNHHFLLLCLVTIIRLFKFSDIFLFAFERRFQYTKECDIWILYAKVRKEQSLGSKQVSSK